MTTVDRILVALCATIVVLAVAGAVWGAEPPAVVPNPALTPGAVYAASEAEVCGVMRGLTYERRSRAVLSRKDKAAITRAYGQVPGHDGDHELDHLVPAALGGRSDATNVWWQPGRGRGVAWTYEKKDLLDTYAWRTVCKNHAVTLAEAQSWFTSDWRIAYCRIFKDTICSSLPTK